MKKFLMILMAAGALLFAGMSSANAQGPGGGFNFDPDEMVKMRVDQMKESLKLKDDQVKKLTDLFKKQNEEMAKMFQGGGMPDMEKMQENMKKQDDEIKKILTADQYKAYSEEQKKMREQFGGGGFGGF